MELYLVRHGPAGKPDPAQWPDDTGRPLSSEGEEEFRQAAKGLGLLAPAVEFVLCSSLLRARQTAAILEAEAGWPAALPHKALAEPSPENLLKSLADYSDASSIALVGHDPFLGWMVSLLITGAADATSIKMGTGSMAHVTVDNLAAGGGTLVGLLQSSDLARM